MVPSEASVKVTVKGLGPIVGSALKPANGAKAPWPTIVFVLVPALPVVKTTRLLKLVAASGENLMVKFVVPKPGKLKGVPESIVNGPPPTVASPLLSAPPPRLVIVRLACAPDPTATFPKSSMLGDTSN